VSKEGPGYRRKNTKASIIPTRYTSRTGDCPNDSIREGTIMSHIDGPPPSVESL
jgi:hypothetical protein